MTNKRQLTLTGYKKIYHESLKPGNAKPRGFQTALEIDRFKTLGVLANSLSPDDVLKVIKPSGFGY